MENKMFCYQCQETAGCKGCTIAGVCGKKPEVAAMQDLLIYVTKGLAAVTTQLRAEGTPVDRATNHAITQNLFATITNANFDKASLVARITATLQLKAQLLAEVKDQSQRPAAATWTADEADYEAKAASGEVGVLATANEDIRSLRELTTYGLKGLSAYLFHANALGYEDETIDAFQQRALAELLDDILFFHSHFLL